MQQPSSAVTTGIGLAAAVVAALGVVTAVVKDPAPDEKVAASAPATAEGPGAEAPDAPVQVTEPAPSTTEAPTTTVEVEVPIDDELDAFLDWLPDGTRASLDLGRRMLDAVDVESDEEMAQLCADVEAMIPGVRDVMARGPVASVREPYLEALDHLQLAVDACQEAIAQQSFTLLQQMEEEFELTGQYIDESTAAMEDYMVSHGFDPAAFDY